MKKSEQLKLESQKEENDFKSLALGKKSIREARLERFEDGYKEALEEKGCVIVPFDGSKITIDTQTDTFGIIDLYPKANRLLIRKFNKWHNHGLKWLDLNILNPPYSLNKNEVF